MQDAHAELLQTIEQFVREDQLNEAINAFFDFDQQAQVNIRKDLMLIAASHQQATSMFSQRLIDDDHYFQEVARVRFALLNLVETMPTRMELAAQIKNLAPSAPTPADSKLEKAINRKSILLDVNWLEKALAVSKAVCRVICENGSLGSGFLSKEGYLFTCNHIIDSPDTASAARIEFNYEFGSDGKPKSRTTYNLDASDFISSPPNDLDFARVKVMDRPDAPLNQWGFVKFNADAVPSVGDVVSIIQHARGEQKRISLHNSEVLSQFNQHLFYNTYTAPGSAGAPVFDINWEVVALHHAGKSEEEGGLVVNAQGHRRAAKRGILFRDIFKFIG